VKAIAALPEMHELNIGHAIIGRAVMSGLKEAVAEMKRLMLEARLMAILGLGTDIVEIARIEAVIARSGDRLARRVLSDHEWASGSSTSSRCVFWRNVCGQRSGGESAGNRHP
jgi:hypothetical protein